MKSNITHASLFSGIGGAEYAAEQMGWTNLFHCEIQTFPRSVLDYWYHEAESYDDITKTDFRKWRGRVTVLTGGFPCQPFSTSGRRRGALDDRYLWPEMLRAIREIHPSWVVGENVNGLTTMVQPAEGVEMGGGKICSARVTYYAESSHSPSTTSSEVLSVKDIPSSRLLFRLVPSERPTAATECGLLPTPSAVEADKFAKTLNTHSQMGQSLTAKAWNGLLPTPMTTDWNGGTKEITPYRAEKWGIKKIKGLLQCRDLATLHLLPTPRTTDQYNGAYTPHRAAQGFSPQLRDLAKMKALPEAKKASRKTDGATSLLNPLYVADMMGFPLTWLVYPFLTQDGEPKASAPSATHGCRKSQSKSSELSN